MRTPDGRTLSAPTAPTGRGARPAPVPSARNDPPLDRPQHVADDVRPLDVAHDGVHFACRKREQMQKRKLGDLEVSALGYGAASVELTAEDLREIEASFAKISVQGARLPEAVLQYSNR